MARLRHDGREVDCFYIGYGAMRLMMLLSWALCGGGGK